MRVRGRNVFWQYYWHCTLASSTTDRYSISSTGYVPPCCKGRLEVGNAESGGKSRLQGCLVRRPGPWVTGSPGLYPPLFCRNLVPLRRERSGAAGLGRRVVAPQQAVQMSRGKKREEELLTHLSQPLRLEVLHSPPGAVETGGTGRRRRESTTTAPAWSGVVVGVKKKVESAATGVPWKPFGSQALGPGSSADPSPQLVLSGADVVLIHARRSRLQAGADGPTIVREEICPDDRDA